MLQFEHEMGDNKVIVDIKLNAYYVPGCQSKDLIHISELCSQYNLMRLYEVISIITSYYMKWDILLSHFTDEETNA